MIAAAATLFGATIAPKIREGSSPTGEGTYLKECKLRRIDPGDVSQPMFNSNEPDGPVCDDYTKVGTMRNVRGVSRR
jgi:hypothetical protein